MRRRLVITLCLQDRNWQFAELRRAALGQYELIQSLEGKIVILTIFRVDIIGNKNTELNYLESKVKLFGGNDAPVRMGGG